MENSEEYWKKREEWVEKHYTDNPHLDTYIITLEVEITFAQENDGVLNEDHVTEWLKHGDVLTDNDGKYEVIAVRKKESQ